MIQELSDKIWKNPKFHSGAEALEVAWLGQDLKLDLKRTFDDTMAARLIEAAAILACSDNPLHRRSAFRVATSAYELFGTENYPLDRALRVVLTRLGNFPSLRTREEVRASQASLPLSLVSEEIFSGDARTVSLSGTDFQLTDFQHRLWNGLIAQRRIALSAPTSAGKSFVLQGYLAHLMASGEPLRVAYIVPTRALIAQVADDLIELFRNSKIQPPSIVSVPLDPDAKLEDRAIYVMTQERIQLCLSTHLKFAADLIVIDEAQSIADGARGILLQWVIDDLLGREPDAQVLFASPTIQNLDVFGRLFGIDNLLEFSSTDPTVAQNFIQVRVDAAASGAVSLHSARDGSGDPIKLADISIGHGVVGRKDKLVHIPLALGRGHSNIVYANGAAEAEGIAIQLAEMLEDREPTAARLELAELAKEAVHGNYVLAECVKRGVAFHYSNIPTQLRRAVESATLAGDIDYLVCTSTLLQGVNLPSKNIFMFAPEKGRTHPLVSTDFWNLAGRAGRLLREFQGNIFLIDYDTWKEKPLSGPKAATIVPAMQSSIEVDSEDLISVIRDVPLTKRGERTDLETTFGRLLNDMSVDKLDGTLSRSRIDPNSEGAVAVKAAIVEAKYSITVPDEVLKRTPNVSAHKQQRLLTYFMDQASIDAYHARQLIPLHPRDPDAFNSYAAILELTYRLIMERDTSKNLHRFHALIALKWMNGTSLPQIIQDQINRKFKADQRTTIRDTLDLIEKDIRFQAVRLFSCYNNILTHAFNDLGRRELIESIPSLPLYLEVGASDRTMISFMALGLSRVTATKLNDLAARKDLDIDGALVWLRTRSLESLGLSPLLIKEVEGILAATSTAQT